MLGDHALHPLGHRRRRQDGLPARGALERRAQPDDLLDVASEALIEHLIGLIEDEVLDVAQARDPVGGEIEDPTRAAHDHVGRVAQPAGLGAVPDPADADHRTQCWVHLADHRVDLGGELAGRRDDQRPGAVTLMSGEALDEWNDERERLPRSGRRFDHAVLAVEQRRDCLLLHRVRRGEAVLTESL